MGPRAGNASVYEQRLAVPDHFVAEIIRGALVTQRRPAARHARAATRLGGALGPFDLDGPGAPGGWIILAASEARSGVARATGSGACRWHVVQPVLSHVHEGLLALFRNQPGLAPGLLRDALFDLVRAALSEAVKESL